MINRGCNSEFMPAKKMLVALPKCDFENIDDPLQIMHYERINYSNLKQEFNAYKDEFKRHSIEVVEIEQREEDVSKYSNWNILFARDLGVSTPWGIIFSNMKYQIRKDEPVLLRKTIESLNYPILGEISGKGTLEGADVLWVSPSEVMVGVGNRTNHEGLDQLSMILDEYSVKIHSVPVPDGIQHLLGVVNIVAENRVLVRHELVESSIPYCLKELGCEIVKIPESDEVSRRQAMNIVMLSPGVIAMPDNCPDTEKLYLDNGIIPIIKTKISQYINGAGGLACATLILDRQIR